MKSRNINQMMTLVAEGDEYITQSAEVALLDRQFYKTINIIGDMVESDYRIATLEEYQQHQADIESSFI